MEIYIFHVRQRFQQIFKFDIGHIYCILINCREFHNFKLFDYWFDKIGIFVLVFFFVELPEKWYKNTVKRRKFF